LLTRLREIPRSASQVEVESKVHLDLERPRAATPTLSASAMIALVHDAFAIK
jgi:hypothetical protein